MTSLHPRTVATLDELKQAEWFSRVGIDDVENAVVLGSWDEAITSCDSLEWENLQQEALNQYCCHLHERDKARFQSWNDVNCLVRPVAAALVKEKSASAMRQHSLPEVFTSLVHSDIARLLIECEFSDVYPPGFYANLADWYVKGHFPCGWQGEFPEGKLVVY